MKNLHVKIFKNIAEKSAELHESGLGIDVDPIKIKN